LGRCYDPDGPVGNFNMGNNISYIHKLEAIVECDQSDGCLKQGGKKMFGDLQFQDDFKSLMSKSPVAVA
jgi:hypothetical protein